MIDHSDFQDGSWIFANKTEFMPADSWRILRIMAEFVDSFDYMSRMPDMLVSVFGSARLPENDPRYVDARATGKLLAESGYGVITGGGPGIMEAASRGAFESVSAGRNSRNSRKLLRSSWVGSASISA